MKGRIDHEVHFDLGSSLAQGLRALPTTIAAYEDRYATYANVWSTGDPSSIASLYAPGAHIADVVGDGVPVQFDDVVGGAMGLRWDVVSADDLFGDVTAMDTPAVFLGPTEYGSDPQRAAWSITWNRMC